MRRRAAAIGAALCLVGAVALHAAADRWVPAPAVDAPAVLYVRSPVAAQRLALEFRAVAADLYWIRALQHFGLERISTTSHRRTYALLYPLLDLTTTLDPYFSVAYRFGAIFLGEPYPGGPGRPDLAIRMLKKGIAAQPGKWRYMQDLGFVYYWHVQDYQSAAAWFERAANEPGAPNWLRPLAAVTLTEGGKRASARELWTELATADETWLRETAVRRLAQLDTMDAIDLLQRRVAAYERAHAGRRPTWDALRGAGLIGGVPLDAAGTPLVIDAAGRVTISRQSALYPLPGDRPSGRR